MSIGRLLQLVPTLAITAGSGAFIAANGPALAEAAARVHQLSIGAVMIGVALSCLAILNRGGKARASHRAVGLGVPRWSMVRPTMAGFTADKVVRSGGLSGMAVMLRHGSRAGYSHGSVWASTVVVKVTSFVSLGVFLLVSVATLALDGRLTRWWLAAAIGFLIYAVCGAALMAVVAHHRGLADRWWERARTRFPRLAKAVGGRDPIGAIADGLNAARTNRRLLRQVAGHAVLAKGLGAAMLLVASHAAGSPLAVSTVVVSYSTVLLASFASMTPGGLGVVEASATALLIGTGVGTTDAIVIVALFRVLDMWIPLIVGAVALWPTRGRRSPQLGNDPTAQRAGESRPNECCARQTRRPRLDKPAQPIDVARAELHAHDGGFWPSDPVCCRNARAETSPT